MPSKAIDIELISRAFLQPFLIPGQISAKFNIDNEEKIWWFDKMAIFGAGHLKRPAFWTTLTVSQNRFILKFLHMPEISSLTMKIHLGLVVIKIFPSNFHLIKNSTTHFLAWWKFFKKRSELWKMPYYIPIFYKLKYWQWFFSNQL